MPVAPVSCTCLLLLHPHLPFNTIMSTMTTMSDLTWTSISYPLPAAETSGVSGGSWPGVAGTTPLLLTTGLGGSEPKCWTKSPGPVFSGVWGAPAGGVPLGLQPLTDELGQGPAQMTTTHHLGEGMPPLQNREVAGDLPLLSDADLQQVFSSLGPAPGQESLSHLGPSMVASNPSRGEPSNVRAREPVELPSYRGMKSRVKFLRMSVKALQQNLKDRLHNHPLRHQRTCPPTCEQTLVSIEAELQQRFLQLSNLRQAIALHEGPRGATPSLHHH